MEKLNEASISDTFDGPCQHSFVDGRLLVPEITPHASRGRGRRREGIVLPLAAVLAAKEKADSRYHQ
jgi:hypothetical protein